MSADICSEEFPGLVIAVQLFFIVAGKDEKSFVHVAQNGSVFAKTCLQSILDGPKRIYEESACAAQDKKADARES